MSKKELFTKSISKMDIKPLKEILVKNAFKKYSNNSFLEKLDEIINELKSSGNTCLILHKGTGICSCNKDKNIFCFVGNNTNDYFALSYQEYDDDYFNFSTSCSEIRYNEKLELNEFYYFSIKPKDTLEYQNHQTHSNPLQEYKRFTSQQKCSMNTIELWLKKHNQSYQNTVELLKSNNLNSVEKLLKVEFEILYGKLSILSTLYQKEAYFKEQVNTYNKIKDSSSKLKEWFNYQDENKNKYQLFSSVFYDNRELTHFNLKLGELTLCPSDFRYTLDFMNIIEDSKSIVFEGAIKTIYDIEVNKNPNTSRVYTQQKIVIAIDDFCCSEYLVTFSEGRIKHLDNLIEGQYVRVLARITGGKSENQEEYKHHLYGWRIETLTAKPKTKENKEEMDLYYKYVLQLPF